MLSAAQRTGLLRDRAELRQGPAVGAPGMFATSPIGVHARVPVHGQVGQDVDAARRDRWPGPPSCTTGAADSPPPQTTVRVGMRRAVVELDPVGVDRGDAGAQPRLGAAAR